MRALCRVEDISSETGKEVTIDGPDGRRYVALFRRKGRVFAYLNTCPHQGRSLNWAPDEFLFGEDQNLVCAHHGACFDIESGECVDGPCKGASLTPVSVVVRDGEVFLDKNQERDA